MHRIAIIDTNTLAAAGLRNILQNVMPAAKVETFRSVDEAVSASNGMFFHYFAAVNIVLDNRRFFIENMRKTIVLTTSTDPNSQLSGFHCLCINKPESELIKSLLALVQYAHAKGRNLPPTSGRAAEKLLSDREIEVLSLIVHGLINKEIANRLNISLSTVVSHRRNIMEKLNAKSVSTLTIYAVMHGYVDINDI